MERVIPSIAVFVKELAHFRKAYAKLCYPHLTKYELSPCEIDILIFLSNNPNSNTAKELVVYLGVAKSLIARSIESLVKRSLLSIQLDENDHRVQRLTLTSSSDEIINLFKMKQEEFSKQVTKNISYEDLQKVKDVLAQINLNIETVVKGENEK